MAHDDPTFFRQRASRQARIRTPAPREFTEAWQALGMHNPGRRRILVWRVPKDNPGRKLVPDGLMRIPFLAEGDETIEDDDFVLLRLLARMMKDASRVEPVNGFAVTGGGAVLADG